MDRESDRAIDGWRRRKEIKISCKPIYKWRKCGKNLVKFFLVLFSFIRWVDQMGSKWALNQNIKSNIISIGCKRNEIKRNGKMIISLAMKIGVREHLVRNSSIGQWKYSCLLNGKELMLKEEEKKKKSTTTQHSTAQCHWRIEFIVDVCFWVSMIVYGFALPTIGCLFGVCDHHHHRPYFVFSVRSELLFFFRLIIYAHLLTLFLWRIKYKSSIWCAQEEEETSIQYLWTVFIQSFNSFFSIAL